MPKIYCGETLLTNRDDKIKGYFTEIDNIESYCIENYDSMDPFFMSITNPDNFWMFISSTGGLTCGRTDSDNALFPYQPDDKVTESVKDTGSYTAFLVQKDNKTYRWLPFTRESHNSYTVKRNIYKSIHGDRVTFEEINSDLNLRFRYGWEFSPAFGIHRKCSLENLDNKSVSLSVCDGMRNILASGISEDTQMAFSNLLNAYKRSESCPEQQLGIYALSATLTDLAEPSECLRATTVWSYGLDKGKILLGEMQLEQFLTGKEIHEETDVKGQRAAHLINSNLELKGSETRTWGQCAELLQNHIDIELLLNKLNDKKSLVKELREDIDAAGQKLTEIIARNDGIQDTGSLESGIHHRVNVLFNIMRGGYFIDGYQVQTRNFATFVKSWNRDSYNKNIKWFDELPAKLSIGELKNRAQQTGNSDLIRFSLEYLPLTFSRRHGDPSRPWNKFSIKTTDDEGNDIIGYQGNWRDIFQNWEALCLSYPGYFPSIISKFLNATTIEGYNPYKISQDGIHWEVPDPDNPWANIGYWSDHQIIYLSKLMEHCQNFFPGTLEQYMGASHFVHSHVPYRIKGYSDLTKDPYDSIVFDDELDEKLEKRTETLGADAKLLADADGNILYSSLEEKLMILFLAKLANYVPGGGIWMNTQRPEWNDANNALAGWGLSVVTLSYLIRFIKTLKELFSQNDKTSFHTEVSRWISTSLEVVSSMGMDSVTDSSKRRKAMDNLGMAADQYRTTVYSKGMENSVENVSPEKILELLDICDKHFRETLAFSQREEGLYESYQVLQLSPGKAKIKRLYTMLEGQVAGLSIPEVPAEESLTIMNKLRESTLYREDQHTYMLYPNRELPGFLKKNRVSEKSIKPILALGATQESLKDIISPDIKGDWHFNGEFTNNKGLLKAAADLPEEITKALLDLFEETFDHSSFTGRSGTFFAYEGLGSIYWHMISKLMLAVQERLFEARESGADSEQIAELKKKYLDIRKGIGFNKTPEVYGAFPCDPYSHTPWGMGAKQPGMTGQVKEEVITRFGELGLMVKEGCITLVPEMILDDQWKEDGTLSFSFCGTQFHFRKGETDSIELHGSNGTVQNQKEWTLDSESSRKIFSRTGEITAVKITTAV